MFFPFNAECRKEKFPAGKKESRRESKEKTFLEGKFFQEKFRTSEFAAPAPEDSNLADVSAGKAKESALSP
jgi:hypothetical protein